MYFDEDEWIGTVVSNTVSGAHGNLDGAARFNCVVGAIERDDCGAIDNDPMLGSFVMHLVGESMARIDRDSLHFGCRAVVEDDELSPRTAFTGAGITKWAEGGIGGFRRSAHGLSMAEKPGQARI